MNILVLGEDKRQMYLAELLKNKGHKVIYLQDFQENVCRKNYDMILFPVVSGKEYYQKMRKYLRGNELLFGVGLMAEYADEHNSNVKRGKGYNEDEYNADVERRKKYNADEIEKNAEEIKKRNIDNGSRKYIDYMQCEDVAYRNAIATAEGTIAELIRLNDINLHGSACLITGYGRCGQVLAAKLKALDCEVAVMDRKSHKRTLAHINGLAAVDFTPEEYEKCGKYQYVINTVPQKIITEELLQYMQKDVIILDLASEPGGVDYAYCRQHRIKAYKELGLPGRFSAKTSAQILLDVIEKNIEMQKY